ncbi:glucokinase [Tundrisphaera lichenicola]|uniref:glucokinase n=1 Tax=Tundrisphaera lichenicola TaxID=2029860 RepID=UPI003EB6F1CD
MILAGDIGGTKTVLALFEPDGEELRVVREATYPSREHATFEEILGEFASSGPGPKVEAACFGVAGAVMDGHVSTTNLPWTLDEEALAESLKVGKATLLNDLEAAAYGTLHLSLEEKHVLNPGTSRRKRGNIAVIAAGTGLGEAILFFDGQKYQPIASEGGHSDFAPQSDLEIDLHKYLRQKFGGHVSYERVLSGPGFFNVYSFFRDTGHAPEPDWLADEIRGGDPSAAVAKAGLAGTDQNCVATLDLFSTIYGAEAGNLALKALAVGGVFVAGGIAPKLLPALTRNDAFLKGFFAKGRFGSLMKNLHVSVALNPRAPLIGAGYYALQH